MQIKHDMEWDVLKEVARKNKLNTYQTILLFALREVEDGEPGREFNVKEAQDTNLVEQAEWVACSIRKNEERFLRDGVKLLEFCGGSNKDKEHDDFNEARWFVFCGGKFGLGWHPSSMRWGKELFYQQLKRCINQINERLDT